MSRFWLKIIVLLLFFAYIGIRKDIPFKDITYYAYQKGKKSFNFTFHVIRGNRTKSSSIFESEEQVVFFKEAPDEVLYQEWMEIGTHNAYANIDEGWEYMQQVWGLNEQLERGVRQLLLDFHYPRSGDPASGPVSLCHQSCALSRFMRLGVSELPAQYAFEVVDSFLKKNRQAVISLDLENYTSSRAVIDIIRSVPGLESYLLMPDMIKNNGKIVWPTYGWLRQQNKRLIIFDDSQTPRSEKENYFFDPSVVLIRNAYGTTDEKRASEPRQNKRGIADKKNADFENDPARLFQLNYIVTVPIESIVAIKKINQVEKIKSVYAHFSKKGYIQPDKAIKYLVMDFVHLGLNDTFQWINERNYVRHFKKNGQ